MKYLNRVSFISYGSFALDIEDKVSIHYTQNIMSCMIQLSALEFNLLVPAMLPLLAYSFVYRPRLLLGLLLASMVSIALFASAGILQTIKLHAELGGLAFVVYYVVYPGCMSLRNFTRIINAAVIFNIAMMVFVPVPEGSELHGLICRSLCCVLTVWLVFLMKEINWETCHIVKGYFIFTGISKSWIVLHSCYRFVLICLPIFHTKYYICMELCTCITMGVLKSLFMSSSGHISGNTSGRNSIGDTKPALLEYFFGMADTLVVPLISVLSAFIHMS